MGKERLKGFAVVLRGADAAEAGHPQGDRHGQRSPAAVVHPCQLRDDLVDRGVGEAVKLHFGNGVEPGHGQAHGHAQNARFGQRGIQDAVRAEAPLQPVGDAEDAAEQAHVLAQDQCLRVLFQDLRERAVQCGLHGQGLGGSGAGGGGSGGGLLLGRRVPGVVLRGGQIRSARQLVSHVRIPSARRWPGP
jgi:hypothetical protein